MILSTLKTWGGIALILLGLVSAIFLKGGALSTLVTFGLILIGMTVKGYDYSAKTLKLGECQHALKRTWIGVLVLFGGLLLAQYFVHLNHLFFGAIFGVIAGTVGPIMGVSYFRCLRRGPD